MVTLLLNYIRLLPRARSVSYLCATIASLVIAMATSADRAHFGAAPAGNSGITRLKPRELALTTSRPANIKRVPKGVSAPYYASIDLGPKEKPSHFTFLLDAPEGKASRLYVDANGNGDFLDDPATEWTHKSYAGRESDHLMMSVGGATLQVHFGARVLPMHVSLSRYDTTEPARAAMFLPIYCTADYAREGDLTLGGKTYHSWLAEALTRGDFRGSGVPGQSGVFLLIDVNRNGKIDVRGETYDAFQPFNIGGTTFELTNIEADGSALDVVKSSRQVAEVLPPPDLGIGKPVMPFEAKATDGHTVRFPEDYKKKVVLLYFWATWCGDCNREVPYVARAFKDFHTAGLEILGVSLDHADQAPQLVSYTREHGMDWPQICDGKVWDAAIAQLYFVTNTPTGLLVDGDTGAILASGQDLLGDRLAQTLAKFVHKR